MYLDPQDLARFNEFVLLDKVRRAPDGKRQTRPMTGFWMERPGVVRGMRKSDQRLRQSVCIWSRIKIGGDTVKEACLNIAQMLDKDSFDEIEVIRVAYYECKPEKYVSQFVSQFLGWRNWTICADATTIELSLTDYAEDYGELRCARLRTLIQAIRNSPEQRQRNREWLLEPSLPLRGRIETGYWKLPHDWLDLATDLWALGRAHSQIGDLIEAEDFVTQAQTLWREHGMELSHLQELALPELEQELAQLRDMKA